MNLDFLRGAGFVEQLFAGFALGGTLFFFLRTAAMLVGGFGGEGHGDAGGHHGGDHHAGGHDSGGHHAGTDPHHADSTASFKLLSLHSATGFAMMFGWIGLAAYRQFALGTVVSLAAAAAAGLGTMYLTAYLLRAALRLSTVKAPFSAQDLVGLDATVYLRIPAKGRGKVQVPYDGVTRELEAISDDDAQIESFQAVRIVRALDERTVGVRKVD